MLPAEGDIVDGIVKDAKSKDDVRVECGAHANCDHIDDMSDATGFGRVPEIRRADASISGI